MFGRKNRERIQEANDPVLGTLRLGEGGSWWEATVVVGNKSVRFGIGGRREPDPVLIEHAHDIVRGFSEFNNMINEFLQSEARRFPGPAEEIRQLEVEEVMLFWPR